MATFPMTLSDPNPGFKVMAFWSRISQKRCILGTKLLKNTNRKPYTICRMIPLSMTVSDLWPHFKVMKFFEDEYRKNIVLKTKLLLHNRKLYLIYGMVLCLLTSIDWPLNASSPLSASAELLVLPARRSKRGICYGNEGGWLGGCLDVTRRYCTKNG